MITLPSNEEDNFLISTGNYIGTRYLDRNDPNYNKNMKNLFDQEQNRYQNSKKILDDEFNFELQKLAKNINDSSHNFTIKK